MTRVTLQNVEKIYGDYTALRSIDLGVVSGEFLTILGPSGAGKSTILGLIGGLIFPTSGAIFIGDRDVTEVEAEKRNVGIVFQNYALFPHLTVAGNVDYPLRIRNIPKDERARRIEAVLQMVRLEKFAGRYPRQLSGGQQQRVALARALVFEPSILLLDEPLGALDTKLREEVRLELLQLQRRLAITTVLVTHDQDEALTLSDRIAVVNDGTIVQTDAPEALYQRPANRFVANFLGLANTLPGTIERSAGGESLVQTKIGLAVRCAAGGAAQGLSGDAILRPEGLMFASAKETNTVAGVVTETVYLGSYTRAYVKIGQEQILIVNVIAGETVPDLGSNVFVAQRKALPGAFVTS